MKKLALLLIAFITLLSATSCEKEDPIFTGAEEPTSLGTVSIDKYNDFEKFTIDINDHFEIDDIGSVLIGSSIGEKVKWVVNEKQIDVEFIKTTKTDIFYRAYITIIDGNGDKYTATIEVILK